MIGGGNQDCATSQRELLNVHKRVLREPTGQEGKVFKEGTMSSAYLGSSSTGILASLASGSGALQSWCRDRTITHEIYAQTEPR